MKQFPAFRHYERNHLCVDIEFSHSQNLQEDILQWAFDLCLRNMKARITSLACRINESAEADLSAQTVGIFPKTDLCILCQRGWLVWQSCGLLSHMGG